MASPLSAVVVHPFDLDQLVRFKSSRGFLQHGRAQTGITDLMTTGLRWWAWARRKLGAEWMRAVT